MKVLIIFLAGLVWVSAGYADVTVTLSHDGSGGVIATIQGSGTTSGVGPGIEADFNDIGDYTDVEDDFVLSAPILFAPGISILEPSITGGSLFMGVSCWPFAVVHTAEIHTCGIAAVCREAVIG